MRVLLLCIFYASMRFSSSIWWPHCTESCNHTYIVTAASKPNKSHLNSIGVVSLWHYNIDMKPKIFTNKIKSWIFHHGHLYKYNFKLLSKKSMKSRIDEFPDTGYFHLPRVNRLSRLTNRWATLQIAFHPGVVDYSLFFNFRLEWNP